MNKLIPFLGAVVFVIGWGVCSKLNILDSFFFPSPRDTFQELGILVSSGAITADIFATGRRSLEAIAIAILLGVPLGLFIGNNNRVYKSLEFLIDFFRSTPATAMFPLFLLLFGIGDTAKVAVAAFGGFLIIIFNTAHGVLHTKKSRILAAQGMGASKWQIFKWIIFLEALPQTFVGLRNAASLTLVIIVVTEMFIGTNVGLGRRIVDSQIVYNIRGMYAMIIATGIVGYALNYILISIEKRYIHWSNK